MLLDNLKWDVLDHLLYSPDLTPSDFHLFFYTKKYIGGKIFDNEEMKNKVMMWFKELADFYDTGIPTGLISAWKIIKIILKNRYGEPYMTSMF